jgi:hypothetical protein
MLGACIESVVSGMLVMRPSYLLRRNRPPFEPRHSEGVRVSRATCQEKVSLVYQAPTICASLGGKILERRSNSPKALASFVPGSARGEELESILALVKSTPS